MSISLILLILQNKRELANANSPIVVLRSEILQNLEGVIGEIEKWVEILTNNHI